ncbi:C40 family peptidase [Hoyosella rhizosphaerae]|uniref:Glycoside hydrolase n=1 Tax=Hoyosella rhizosphaerae TaxID=1755582 RepID=A0A916UAG5_9ACTN|nr:C40 family peptidase [Hoyosella rhizosphaerae]MBN4926062.1 C40 family peptidase [Hoyosella rhizosphaerae]GGC65854.1 glycoside hydrolase [Hoyosella rhizosphaerae]
MIDVQLLKQPLDDLAATLGTGMFQGVDPVREFDQVGTTLQQVCDCGLAAVKEIEPAWSGLTAETALAEGRELARGADALANDSQALSVNWLAAIESVLRGVGELALIGASFVNVLQNSRELLSQPLGQLVLLKEALDHLSRALDVVLRISAELSVASGNISAVGSASAVGGATMGPPGGGLPGSGLMGSAEAQQSGFPSTHSASYAENGPYSASDSLAVGTASVLLPDGTVAQAPTPQAADAVRNALSQQGVPYVWGGTSPGAGFDCSGLTQWAYGQAGVDIPRLAHEQSIGTPVGISEAMAGDLVVWDGHVAMALGNGQMIEAGNPISVSPMRTDNMGQAFHGVYRPTS